VLAQLCQLAGLPTEVAQRITSGLQAAWAPAGSDSTGTGQTETPLPPARLSDLVWLGIDSASLQRLAPWVDLLPVRTTVNANTAAREVLMAAIPTLDAGSAERLVQLRQRKPFETMDDVTRQLPERPADKKFDLSRISVGSKFFEAYGRLRLEDRVLEERSLLERRPGEVVTLRRERVSLSAPAR
jgi:general secretion pathway protein K